MTYCHTCKTGLVEPGDGIEVDEETGEPLYAVEPLPEPEVYAMPVEMTDPRVSQGVRNVIKPGLAAGWRIIGLAYARGPRVGSKGQALSISDSISLVMYSADGNHKIWATWLDGKSSFAYTQQKKHSMVKVGSKAAIAYMKEHPAND